MEMGKCKSCDSFTVTFVFFVLTKVGRLLTYKIHLFLCTNLQVLGIYYPNVFVLLYFILFTVTQSIVDSEDFVVWVSICLAGTVFGFFLATCIYCK